VVTTPLASGSGLATNPSFYVQAGAFRAEANSEVLRKKIQELPLAENVIVAKVYNGDLYRIRLGPFSSKEDADVSAALIRKQLNIATIVQNQ